jgi:hypothetical protein
MCVCALCAAALLAFAGAPAWAAGAKSFGGAGALSNPTKGASETKPSSTATTITTAPTATTATTETTKESEPHNSRSVILVIAGAAVLLLSGVAFVIVRDARKMAPASEVEFAEGSTPRHTEAALRKRRAKAKAARQQRKRNR